MRFGAKFTDLFQPSRLLLGCGVIGGVEGADRSVGAEAPTPYWESDWLSWSWRRRCWGWHLRSREIPLPFAWPNESWRTWAVQRTRSTSAIRRSEERRVGKECRSRW